MTATAIGGFMGVGKNVGADLRQAKVARDKFFAVYNANLQADLKKVPAETTRRREIDDVALDEIDVSWDLETEGTTEGPLLYLLTSLLGVAPTSTQDGADTSYQHAYAGVGETTPNAGRLSFEKRLGTQAVSWLANGVVEEWEHSFSQAGYTRHKFSGPASKLERLASPTAASFPSSGSILARRMCTLTLDSVTTLPVHAGSWKIKANRKMDDFDVTSRDRRDADFDGYQEVTFALDVLAPDDGWLRRYLGGSARDTAADPPEATYACNLKVERPDVFTTTRKHKIELDLPRVTLSAPKSIPIEGAKTLGQRIEGRALYNSGTTRSLTLNVRNSLASA